MQNEIRNSFNEIVLCFYDGLRGHMLPFVFENSFFVEKDSTKFFKGSLQFLMKNSLQP